MINFWLLLRDTIIKWIKVLLGMLMHIKCKLKKLRKLNELMHNKDQIFHHLIKI